MTTDNTVRQGEFAGILGWTKDALRSAEATGNTPYDRASLPGEKQKRYGAVELVSLVLMDLFRSQGLSNKDAASASEGALQAISGRLSGAASDEQSGSNCFAYFCSRQLSNPSGALMGDTNVGCEPIELLSSQFADWATGVDLTRDPLAIASSFAWVHSGPSLHVVSVENAVQLAHKLARAKGYSIKGTGLVPIAAGQE